LSALPHHIRSALVGHDSVSLDQYAAIADSMLAVAQRPVQSFIGAVDHSEKSQSNQHFNNGHNNHRFESQQSHEPFNNANRQHYPDNRQYNNDSRQHYFSNSLNFSQNRTFAPRPYYEGQRPRVCNSHIYFGSRAKHCRPWCEWPDKPSHIMHDNEKTPRQSRASSPLK